MYPAEDPKDYAVRLGAATIDGLTTAGVDTLCGTVFHGDIDTSKVNSAIIKHLENIDNEGNHFNVFTRRAFESSFDGFSLIMVDVPKVEGEVKSLADEKKLGIRPYWRLYKASDVINWVHSVDPISKQTRLTMVVLREIGEEIVDRFERKPVTRYRVLFVDGNTGKWELWRQKDKAASGDEFTLETNGQGAISNVTEIPVASIGKFIDDPKLLVESRLEVRAYQKESSFDAIEYLSVPTFYTKGYEGEEAIALGAAAHVKLPLEGEVGYAQIDAAGHESLKGTIADIKAYIKSRVSMMVESAVSPDKTATEAVIQNTDKQARLIVWAEELKDALEKALGFHAQLMGLGEDKGGEITLATKWQAEKEAREKENEIISEDEARSMKDRRAEIG